MDIVRRNELIQEIRAYDTISQNIDANERERIYLDLLARYSINGQQFRDLLTDIRASSASYRKIHGNIPKKEIISGADIHYRMENNNSHYGNTRIKRQLRRRLKKA